MTMNHLNLQLLCDRQAQQVQGGGTSVMIASQSSVQQVSQSLIGGHAALKLATLPQLGKILPLLKNRDLAAALRPVRALFC